MGIAVVTPPPQALSLTTTHYGQMAKLNNAMGIIVATRHPSLSPSNLHVDLITCHPH
jgi:hypothetical protein